MNRKKKAIKSFPFSFIEGVFLLLILASNGFYLLLYYYLSTKDMINSKQIIVYMTGYLIFVIIIMGAVAILVRRIYFSNPLKKLSVAARKVTVGDFSVRIATEKDKDTKTETEALFEDFDKMVEELSSIQTLKNDFISNVSHEIKTPLSIISNYATALGDETLTTETRKEYTKTIAGAAQNLTGLVTNILKLSKLENQEIVPIKEPYDLSEQLRINALGFEELWENKGINFTADIEDDVFVQFDESMLALVFNNLLSNAIKFTESGGYISLTLRRMAHFAYITVTDTGCGMSSETQKRVFDKFYQKDTSHAQDGNGLGLALAKRVIELLDGEIKVESTQGIGTTFTVRLEIQ